MSLLKLKAKHTHSHTQPPENSEEAKGIHVAFLLSSEHDVSTHTHPVSCHISESFL